MESFFLPAYPSSVTSSYHISYCFLVSRYSDVMSDLQQLGLLLSELLQLLQWLQEQFGSGEDLQALLRSQREAKFAFGFLHLLQGPSHRLHIGQDHLQVGTEKLVTVWVDG